VFDILEFSLLDFLDIFLVAILLFYVYKLLRGTVAINIFIGIAIIFFIWKITQALGMEMLSSILGALISGGVLALIIVFQQEIRKFLLMIGSTNFTSKRSLIKQLKFLKTEIKPAANVQQVVNACFEMGKTKTGALIVFERTHNLDFVKSTGDKMLIEVGKPILKSIFYKNSPLHDGAIIIKGNRIIATRVILPVSKKDLPSHFGLRHRAAMGISEKTDAICLIVSEETGKVSYIKDGKIILYKDPEDLTLILQYDLDME